MMKKRLYLAAGLMWSLGVGLSGCAHLRDQVAALRYGQAAADVEATLGRDHEARTVARGTLWTYHEGSDACEIELRAERVATPPACKSIALEDGVPEQGVNDGGGSGGSGGSESAPIYGKTAGASPELFYRERLEARAAEGRKYAESRQSAAMVGNAAASASAAAMAMPAMAR